MKNYKPKPTFDLETYKKTKIAQLKGIIKFNSNKNDHMYATIEEICDAVNLSVIKIEKYSSTKEKIRDEYYYCIDKVSTLCERLKGSFCLEYCLSEEEVDFSWNRRESIEEFLEKLIAREKELNFDKYVEYLILQEKKPYEELCKCNFINRKINSIFNYLKEQYRKDEDLDEAIYEIHERIGRSEELYIKEINRLKSLKNRVGKSNDEYINKVFSEYLDYLNLYDELFYCKINDIYMDRLLNDFENSKRMKIVTDVIVECVLAYFRANKIEVPTHLLGNKIRDNIVYLDSFQDVFKQCLVDEHIDYRLIEYMIKDIAEDLYYYKPNNTTYKNEIYIKRKRNSYKKYIFPIPVGKVIDWDDDGYCKVIGLKNNKDVYIRKYDKKTFFDCYVTLDDYLAFSSFIGKLLEPAKRIILYANKCSSIVYNIPNRSVEVYLPFPNYNKYPVVEGYDIFKNKAFVKAEFEKYFNQIMELRKNDVDEMILHKHF